MIPASGEAKLVMSRFHGQVLTPDSACDSSPLRPAASVYLCRKFVFVVQFAVKSFLLIFNWRHTVVPLEHC